MRTNLISISGKKGHGKDTVANIIQYLDFKQSCDRKGDTMSIIARSKAARTTFNEFMQERIHESGYDIGGHSMYECEGKWSIQKYAAKLKEIVGIFLGVGAEKLEDKAYIYTELPEEWWFITDGIFSTAYSPETWEKISKLKHIDYKLVKPTPRWFMQNIGTEAIRNNIHQNAWVNALFADYKPEDYLITEVMKGHYGQREDYISKGIEAFKLVESRSNWLVTDTRFPNELSAITDRGGVTIKVIRHKSSEEWQKEFKDWFKVIDPDGWDRSKFTNSWFKEKITQEAFFDRLMGSTCEFYKSFEELMKTFRHKSETSLNDYTNWDYVIINDGSLEDLVEKVRIIFNSIK